MLDAHDIIDGDIESSLETLAKEYNKHDGGYAHLFLRANIDGASADATMKVSLAVLERVYQSLQDQTQRDDYTEEQLDPEKHLFVIDAFEMPRWHWSGERGTFERFVHIVVLVDTPTPESQVSAVAIYIWKCGFQSIGYPRQTAHNPTMRSTK